MPEPKVDVQGPILTASGSAATILTALDALEARNAALSGRRTWGCLTAALVLGAGLVLGPILPFLAPLFFLAVPIALIVAWRSSSAMLDTSRLPVLREFLTVLGEDADERRGFNLTADLEGPEVLRKRTDHQSSFWSNLSVSTYVDPWLSGSASLRDGCSLRFAAETTLVVKAKSKRKRTKRRARYRQKVSLRLQASPASFRGFRPPDELVGRQVGSLEIRTVSLEGHDLRATLVSAAADVGAPSLLQGLSALYGLLIPLSPKERKGARRAAAAASA